MEGDNSKDRFKQSRTTDHSAEDSKENLIEIEVLENAVEKLSELEQTFRSYQNNSKLTKGLLYLKNIDLIESLDAIVYKLEITNELCNINDVITKVENGFSKLKCSQPKCHQNAIMYVKTDENTPAKLYCEIHLRCVYEPDDDQYFLDEELEEDIEILESLEKLLIILQEQMQYITKEDESKHYQAYKKVKNLIDDEYKSLKNTLKEITMKSERINEFEIKANQIPQYEPLSFVREDSK